MEKTVGKGKPVGPAGQGSDRENVIGKLTADESALGANARSGSSVHECEQHFRLLVEGIATAIWETDPTGRIVIDSPSWRKATGQSASEYLGLCWHRAVHADDASKIQQSWLDCMQRKDHFRAEFRWKLGSDVWAWMQCHAAPLCDADDQVLKWVFMVIDISERKLCELEQVKRESQFELALDISRTSFWTFVPSHNHVRMDARMRQMWGESSIDANIPIDKVMSRIHPDDRPKVWESVTAALEPTGTGVYLPTDYRILLDDGSIRWLAANGMATFEGHGTEKQSVELFGTVLDITARKLTEDSLRESEERLQNLNSELELRVDARTQELVASEKRLRAAVEMAEQYSRQLRRLAVELSRTEQRERRRLAQILHDHLQQLLVAAKMRVEMLAEDIDQQENQERLVGIATVIDVAIDATRSLAVELAPPLLHAQGLPSALEWLAVHFHEQHRLQVEVSVDTTANPVSEEARDLLFQAARELLLNVIKHAYVTLAHLQLQLHNGDVVLEVSDQGAGFDPQAVVSEAPTFGLFHLRERLAAVGGELQIESQPTKGTCVRVRLAR